jgi:hypothetical protein
MSVREDAIEAMARALAKMTEVDAGVPTHWHVWGPEAQLALDALLDLLEANALGLCDIMEGALLEVVGYNWPATNLGTVAFRPLIGALRPVDREDE